MTSSSQAKTNKKRLRNILLGGLGVVVLLAGLGIWWFLRDDAPPEVSLDAALENVATTAVIDDSSTNVEANADITGMWLVDTTSGAFDYETATGSFVGFRIEEELNGIGSTTAVGRTGDIGGSMVIDTATVTDAEFTIDMTTITTNDSRRDDNAQDALETSEFPTASFTLVDPIELDAASAGGEPVTATVAGDLTIHGVTQRVDFVLQAQLVAETVVVVGSTNVTFSAYGVEVPSGGPVISVDDFGVLELQLLLTRS